MGTLALPVLRAWRSFGIFRFGDDVFEAAVGYEPKEGSEDVEGAGDPWLDEGEGNSEGVKDGREFSFPIFTNGEGEVGLATAMFCDDEGLQNIIRNGSAQENAAVESRRK